MIEADIGRIWKERRKVDLISLAVRPEIRQIERGWRKRRWWRVHFDLHDMYESSVLVLMKLIN